MRDSDLHITVAIHEIALMISRIFNAQVKDEGLTRTQWQVLHRLYMVDGQTQTDLADALTMAKPPLGKVLDRLEDDGWIERREDPDDRRAKRVLLTQKVLPLIAPLEDIVEEIGRTAMTGFTAKDRKKAETLTRRMHRNLADAIEAKLN